MVDVVVRLHGPTDQAPKARHLRVLAHVQLDDVPRTHDPVELRRRASSVQQRGDSVDEVTDAGLRLSTATI